MIVLDALKAAIDARQAVALVTVIGTRGSTPRKPGAMMLVSADGRLLSGTVGGGTFEHRILEKSPELIRQGGFHRITIHLTRELAMCCGGEMEVTVDVHTPPHRLILFGAGHIAQALCPMAAACGFDVVVIDDREEFLNDPSLAAASSRLDDPLGYARHLALEPSDLVTVMTASHDQDQAILEKILADNVAGFVGLIGSKTKWAKFRERLVARGLPDERVDAVECPLGLHIHAETPAEIAISVLAGLIEHLRRPRQELSK